MPFIQAEQLLANNSSITLRASGLPPKKREEPSVSATAATVQLAYLPPQPVIPQKQPLANEIITLQDTLNQEIESRNNQFIQAPTETIMVYGKLIAQQHYPKLQDNIEKLSQTLQFGYHKKLESKEEILEFYNEVIKNLGYNNVQTFSIRGSLQISYNEHFNPHRKIYIVKGEKTQYDYMLTVANQVHHIYQIYKDNPKVKEEVEFLLQNFFGLLGDQAGKCQTGMVGRMFMAQKSLYDNLIDLYKKI